MAQVAGVLLGRLVVIVGLLAGWLYLSTLAALEFVVWSDGEALLSADWGIQHGEAFFTLFSGVVVLYVALDGVRKLR